MSGDGTAGCGAAAARCGAALAGGVAALLALSALAPGPRQVAAEDPATDATCPTDCGGDVDCERRGLACRRGRGQGRAAIEHLKGAVARFPERPALGRLLAAAYLAEGNAFWAQRTLQKLVAADPADCASRAWLAWVRLQAGDPTGAEAALAGGRCPATAPQRGRWDLLALLVARAREDTAGAAAARARLDGVAAMYREDARALEALRRQWDPGWLPLLHLEANLSFGATSNAGAGLPTTEAAADGRSAVTRLEVYGRVAGRRRARLRPLLEWSLRGHRPGSLDRALEETRYAEVSLRPGAGWEFGAWRGAVGYRADLFVLNQGDVYGGAPHVYHEGHRAEVEAEAPGGWTGFAGAGRRWFRHRARTRWEMDGGAGRAVGLAGGGQGLAALSLRHYPAEGKAHTQTGATLLAVGRWPVGPGRHLRLGVSLGRDRYAAEAGESGGRDLMARLSAQGWTRVTAGWRAGLTYEVSRRWSSAAVSYSYTEHRLLFKVRAAAEPDLLGPARVGPEGRVPLPLTGAAAKAGLDEERIRDLLRQDEAARRSSSCAN